MKNKLNFRKSYVYLSIIGMLLIVVGVSYSFFSYAIFGTTESSIASDESIRFVYEEGTDVNNGISLQDAMPKPDSEGKTQDNYFDFSVTGSTKKARIGYVITARKDDRSDNLDGHIKVYLTKLEGNNEREKVLSIYDALADSDLALAQNHTEKTLLESSVPADSNNYIDNYRLRMWLSDDVGLEYTQTVTGTCSDSTYTTEEDCVGANKDWTDVATPNTKTFILKINAYANGEIVGEDEMISANSTAINNVEVNNLDASLIESDEENHDYLSQFVDEFDLGDLDVETKNPSSTYAITKIGEDDANDIKEISTSNKKIEASFGNNYYKITVTSPNRKKTKDYVLKVMDGLRYQVDYNNSENSNVITLQPNTEVMFDVNITSLNYVDSNYQLYYISDNPNAKVGYTSGSVDTPSGMIEPDGQKTVKIIIKNRTESTATVRLGLQGEFTNNELVLKEGTPVDTILRYCDLEVNDVINFTSPGLTEFEVSCPGKYTLEVWGGQGGSASGNSKTSAGGKGGYSKGNAILTETDTLNIVVGGKGTNCAAYTNDKTYGGGYNGGGTGRSCSKSSNGKSCGGGGGGATHIAKKAGTYKGLSSYGNITTAKNYVYIVAGGGGGGQVTNASGTIYNKAGGAGGGTSGGSSRAYTGGDTGKPGTQSGGYAFGSGKYGVDNWSVSGGGGGLYGGYNGQYVAGSGLNAAGGGSGYLNTSLLISGTTSTTAGNNTGNGHATLKYLGQ